MLAEPWTGSSLAGEEEGERRCICRSHCSSSIYKDCDNQPQVTYLLETVSRSVYIDELIGKLTERLVNNRLMYRLPGPCYKQQLSLAHTGHVRPNRKIKACAAAAVCDKRCVHSKSLRLKGCQDMTSMLVICTDTAEKHTSSTVQMLPMLCMLSMVCSREAPGLTARHVSKV